MLTNDETNKWIFEVHRQLVEMGLCPGMDIEASFKKQDLDKVFWAARDWILSFRAIPGFPDGDFPGYSHAELLEFQNCAEQGGFSIVPDDFY